MVDTVVARTIPEVLRFPMKTSTVGTNATKSAKKMTMPISLSVTSAAIVVVPSSHLVPIGAALGVTAPFGLNSIKPRKYLNIAVAL